MDSNTNRPTARQQLRATVGIQTEISDLGADVAALLSDWAGGLHHLDRKALRRVDWSNDIWIQMIYFGSLASYDFSSLTTLVFLAHDYCIRVSVEAASPKHLRLVFHPRMRVGINFLRHPTIEEALARWRGLPPTVQP